MKVAALFLLCAAAAARGDLDGFYDNGCPKDTSVEKLLPHANCDQFYMCVHGALITRFCPSGLNYNPKTQNCDWPGQAKCIKKRANKRASKPVEHSEELDNSNPAHVDAICGEADSNGELVAHINCNQFYKCLNGKAEVLSCAKYLLYNPINEKCDWPLNVDCGKRLKFVERKKRIYNRNADNAGNSDDIAINNDPSQAPVVCTTAGSDGILIAHENCNQYYKCFAGRPITMNCPLNLLYNPGKEYCDWPRNVECGERLIPENDNSNENVAGGEVGGEAGGDNNNITGDDSVADSSSIGNSDPSQAPIICKSQNSEGVLVAHENCNQFYKCSGGIPVGLNCPGILLYNPEKAYCDWPHNVECGESIRPEEESKENDNNSSESGGDNSEPNQAASICAASGSDGVLVAHEKCTQFYKCHLGLPVAMRCPGILLYNTETEYCDWPVNVSCGDRVIPENNDDSNENNGDNGNSNGNNHHDPKEATAICAADNSDGVLVAHENCNQFYQCFGGNPVALFCPIKHLYSPRKEYCDWQYNVDCGNRYRPADNDNNSNDNNNPTCTTSADGEVTPHENCSQFYKCLSGQGYPMECPPGLYFNTNLKVCDWPSNVLCGDRLTETIPTK